MLILSRKKGEQIRINDDIQFTLLEIKGNNVRLGFLAPGEVVIHREEVYQRIQDELRSTCAEETSRHE